MTELQSASTPEWRQLEALVADIQRQLSPNATVTHNAKLPGHDSETTRQIDVLVQQSVGQFPMTIVIDCKDYGKPVDVKGIEEFKGLVSDVRAHQGSIVSARGFTKSAKKLARRSNISLFSPVDTAPHKWQTRISIPVLCEFRGAAIAFQIKVTTPLAFKMPGDFFYSLPVFDASNTNLGPCVENALRRWNRGEYPTDVGVHDDVPIFPTSPVYVDNGHGRLVEVELTLSLAIKGRRYFGHLPLESVRGLRDEQTGALHTNAFKTGVLSAVEVENQWQRLSEDIPFAGPVVLSIMGLDCYEVQGHRVRR